MKINYQTILKDDNKELRNKSVDVALPLSVEDKELLQDLLTYVRNSQDDVLAEKENLRPAVGIAAPQIGIMKRLLAIVVTDEDDNLVEYALANPRIVSHSVQQSYLKGGEGCLSVEEEHKGYVPRYARITIEAYDLLRDRVLKIKATDFLAIVLQHEMDHFEGILFYDRINTTNPFKKPENSIVIE